MYVCGVVSKDCRPMYRLPGKQSPAAFWPLIVKCCYLSAACNNMTSGIQATMIKSHDCMGIKISCWLKESPL